MNIEQQILSHIVHNEQYARAVLPHIKEEYFSDKAAKLIFKLIREYAGEYVNVPSIGALQIEVDRSEGVEEDSYTSAMSTLDTMKTREPVDTEWLIKRTEEYCQERAMDLALREAILIQNDPKRSKGEIPHIMQEALQVTFESEIGHDHFDDAEARYDYFHSDVQKIPFDIDILNQATNGGVERKTLNVLMAGCVHPDTEVTISYKYFDVLKRKTCPIKQIKELMDMDIDVDILGPDGYVRVAEYVEKGSYEEFIISTEDGYNLRCNADHLVKTFYGWESAENLARICEAKVEQIHVQTQGGPKLATCRKTGMMIPIVDVVVGHDNHRYYANRMESHNTNVGKSLMLCHFAAADVLAGRNVLYITAEMSEEKISQRIDANLLDVSLDEYDKMPKKWFLEKVANIKEKCGGRIIVHEYAGNSAHVGHIRHLLQELKLKKGFVPDVIYVDYLNIMKCQRYRPGQVPKHEYVKGIAEELRGLGQTENIPVWSATQTNREGFKSSDADMTDVSEAWGLPATVDFFLIIIQPDDLVEMGQFLCKQEKSRYSNKDKLRKFFLGVNKDKQKLYDLDRQPHSAGEHYDANFSDYKFRQGGEDEEDENPFDQFRS